jgi:hypothetical protein
MDTMDNSITRKIALYLVKAFHCVCTIICLIGPYITNDVFYLTLIVLYCSGVYFFWYVLGYCIFTALEEYLGEPSATYNDGMKKSFMTTFFEQMGINESIVSNVFVTIPAISVIVGMYKINMQYNNSVIKNTIYNLADTLPVGSPVGSPTV